MADIEILGGFLGLRPSRPLGISVCIDGKDCEKDIEILGGFLGLRPSRPLGIFVCIDGKDCEKDALVGFLGLRLS